VTYVCSLCGALAAGCERCLVCEAPGAFMKAISTPIAPMKKSKGVGVRKEPSRPMKVKALASDLDVPRLQMDPKGFGKALPRGVLVILSGDPGAGKSTFVISVLKSVVGKVLYVCAEESAHLVADRARRVGGSDDMLLFHTQSIFGALKAAQDEHPDVLAIDSLNASTGVESHGENASLADRLQAVAKWCIDTGCTAIVISHVNKDGEVYGPTTLEHTSDINMHIAVDEETEIRTIKCSKNRFGPTGIYGEFKLVQSGIAWVEKKAEKEEERGEANPVAWD
jgi:DNA repair protein RadA/Sms